MFRFLGKITNWTNRWETRKFWLCMTYSFGSGKKQELKAVDLDNEVGRL